MSELHASANRDTAAGYVLGQSERAARRLAIQDAHFADVSERLLDEVALRRNDRVVELGCGPGGFSRRIVRRLGKDGTLVAVDCSDGLLIQAKELLEREMHGAEAPRLEMVLTDIAQLGSWLDGADAVLARTMLHHVPMAEFVLGRLRAAVRPGTRVGFLEPDFRSPLARLAYQEASGRKELTPLRMWAIAINELYLANRLSPDVGATLGRTLEMCGYRNVRTHWVECRSDELMIENMLMFYDEVRDRLDALGILSKADNEREQQRLRALNPQSLPAVWGIYLVAAEA